jgi:predicted small secreted protein
MKKLFIAMAFALATLTGCNSEDTIGHGDIYVAGHQGKLCTGTLKLKTLFITHILYAECDNGVNILDMKNVSLYHNNVKADSLAFQEVFGK